MRNINHIRQSLNGIDALVDVDPIKKRSGNEDGVIVRTNNPIGADEPFNDNIRDIYTDKDYNPQDGGFKSYDDVYDDIDGENDHSEELDDFDPLIEHGAEADDKLPLLGYDEDEEIRQNIEENGTDALGYYRSFHITGKQWGVFITAKGLFHMAKHFASLGLSNEIAFKNAFQLILSHELFHFSVDYALSQLEIILGEPLWIPKTKSELSKNPDYLTTEEKMANAYMQCRARTGRPDLDIKGKAKLLKEFIKSQPAGYRDSLNVNRSNFNENLSRLGRDLISEAINGGASLRSYGILSRSFEWPAMFQYRPQVDWRYCPIFILDDSHKSIGKLPDDHVQAFAAIDTIRETSKFLKMLTKLPNIIQAKWVKTKSSLNIGIRTGHDFKKWPKGGTDVFSIRVDAAVRVHLWYDRANKGWSAIEIGKHKEMGHG